MSIPKILHYCWFGDNPIPDKTKKCIATWKELCPDYKLMRWDESNFDISKRAYTREAFENKKWAFISDVCRLEKVYEHGGIYLDVNTEALKSFDDLLENDMFVGFEQDNHIQMGVFGAKKHHEILKSILQDFYEKSRLLSDDGKINYRTINSRVHEVLVERGMESRDSYQELDGVTVYPKEYFCPRYWNSARQDPITDKTYTNHYFGASWHDEESRKWLNFITSDKAPRVSVVIPVYGVEKYIESCLDSVSIQSYANIEVIVVDDQSPDQSGAIAEAYALKDDRIKVIHKPKNEGLNMARATGFECSTGDMILFVDSDDLLAPDCIESAVRLQLKYKADFVRFGMCNYVDEESPVEVIKRQPSELVEEFIEGRGDLLRANLYRGTITVWGALYTRKAVEGIDWRASNYQVFEDNFWSLHLLKNIKTGVYTTRIGYLYRTSEGREESVLSRRISGNSFNGQPVGYLEFVDRLLKEYRSYNKRYSLRCEDAIRSVEDWHWNHRLEQISKIDNWQPEKSDIGYVIKLLQWIERKKSALEANDATQNEQIMELGERARACEAERIEFLGVKRSLRLTAGNIKRRVKRRLG